MKYLVDIDALKDCLDMIEAVKLNGHDYVALHNVKLFIDRFPKDMFEIPELIINNNCENGITLLNKATDVKE